MTTHSHQAQIPQVVYSYVKAHVNAERPWEVHPIIASEFVPGKGWVRTSFGKRVSVSWCRKLKAAGVTHVALNLGCGRVADFSVAEIVRGGVVR